MAEATLKGTFEAGALVRKQVRNLFEEFCWEHGIELEVVEQKAWLSSKYLLTVRGTEEKVKQFQNFMQRVADWLNKDED